MLLIGPVDAYERHELRLLLASLADIVLSSSFLVLVAFTSGRGWLCFREALIVEPSLRRCSGLHLSIRLGSKARPDTSQANPVGEIRLYYHVLSVMKFEDQKTPSSAKEASRS